MAQLLAAFADFTMLAEDKIHDADRAVVDPFIEQSGVDFGRGLVGKRGACNTSSTTCCCGTLNARAGLGRGRSTACGAVSLARLRYTLARETPNAAQAAAVMLLSARVPQRPRSRRVAAGRQRDAQQRRNFFLNVDDDFGRCQAQREAGVVGPSDSQFGYQRVGLGGPRAALGGNLCTVGAGVTLPAPVGEGR